MSDESLRTSLKRSENTRAAYLQKFGFMPLSVLRIKRGTLSSSLYNYARESGMTTTRGERAERGGVYASKRLRMSGGGSRSSTGRALSVMPGELVEFFIKYYARPGQTYIDPFMGQGVRMQVAKRFGMHYRGYDLSRDFFDYIEAVRRKIDDGKTTITVTHGDSRFPTEIPDACGDFSFHSPPYWDIEYYGDDPAQLGTGKSYEEFLSGMEDVARAWLPKFKPQAWHIVNVNDFRKDGVFYCYHADLIRAFTRAGWRLHDLWIVDGLVGGLPQVFAADFNSRRVAPKVHEYAIVFRK